MSMLVDFHGIIEPWLPNPPYVSLCAFVVWIGWEPFGESEKLSLPPIASNNLSLGGKPPEMIPKRGTQIARNNFFANISVEYSLLGGPKVSFEIYQSYQILLIYKTTGEYKKTFKF